MQKIVPCLWFDREAQDAAEFYTQLFGGRITDVAKYPTDTPGGRRGEVMTVEFELFGQSYTGLNGGPTFTFTEAISLQVDCADQAEVDRYWDALVEGGQAQPCGWLKDRYGLSWQIVPNELTTMLKDSDPEKVRRVADALLATFGKFEIAALRAAFEGQELAHT